MLPVHPEVFILHYTIHYTILHIYLSYTIFFFSASLSSPYPQATHWSPRQSVLRPAVFFELYRIHPTCAVAETVCALLAAASELPHTHTASYFNYSSSLQTTIDVTVGLIIKRYFSVSLKVPQRLGKLFRNLAEMSTRTASGDWTVNMDGWCLAILQSLKCVSALDDWPFYEAWNAALSWVRYSSRLYQSTIVQEIVNSLLIEYADSEFAREKIPALLDAHSGFLSGPMLNEIHSSSQFLPLLFSKVCGSEPCDTYHWNIVRSVIYASSHHLPCQYSQCQDSVCENSFCHPKLMEKLLSFIVEPQSALTRFDAIQMFTIVIRLCGTAQKQAFAIEAHKSIIMCARDQSNSLQVVESLFRCLNKLLSPYPLPIAIDAILEAGAIDTALSAIKVVQDSEDIDLSFQVLKFLHRLFDHDASSREQRLNFVECGGIPALVNFMLGFKNWDDETPTSPSLAAIYSYQLMYLFFCEFDSELPFLGPLKAMLDDPHVLNDSWGRWALYRVIFSMQSRDVQSWYVPIFSKLLAPKISNTALASSWVLCHIIQRVLDMLDLQNSMTMFHLFELGVHNRLFQINKLLIMKSDQDYQTHVKLHSCYSAYYCDGDRCMYKSSIKYQEIVEAWASCQHSLVSLFHYCN